MCKLPSIQCEIQCFLTGRRYEADAGIRHLMPTILYHGNQIHYAGLKIISVFTPFRIYTKDSMREKREMDSELAKPCAARLTLVSSVSSEH
jgi:hypothetical protein